MRQPGTKTIRRACTRTILLIAMMSGLQCLGVEAARQPQHKLGMVRPPSSQGGTKDSSSSPALTFSRRRELASPSSSRSDSPSSSRSEGVASSPLRWLTRVRGGVQPATSKSKVKATAPTATGNKIRYAGEAGTKQKVKEWYKATPIITRLHLTTSLLLTGLGLVAIDPSYFLLDPVKIVTGLQLWRPFTAAAFMGPPSMSWVSNLYFLHQYGTCRGASCLACNLYLELTPEQHITHTQALRSSFQKVRHSSWCFCCSTLPC